METDIEKILDELRRFNRERDWDQFHNGKDLAIGLSVEASELLEVFLWKAPEDADLERIREELADISIRLKKRKAVLRNIMSYDCLQFHQNRILARYPRWGSCGQD